MKNGTHSVLPTTGTTAKTTSEIGAAWGSRPTWASACAGLLLLAGSAAAQPVLAISTFDLDAEGWRVENFPGNAFCNAPGIGAVLSTDFAWIPSGGMPGGYIRFREFGNTNVSPLFRAPGAFLGNFSSAYGGFLTYDRRTARASFGRIEDVYLQGGGINLIADTAGVPNAPWGGSFAPLSVGTWKVGTCEGPFATEAQIRQVLSNVTALLIAAEYRSGDEDEDLDNVAIVGPSQTPLPVISTFDTNSEGWFAEGHTTILWNAAGGNPGGCISGRDVLDDTRYNWEFCAPVKFLGNKSLAYGLTLAFDLRSPGLLGVPVMTSPAPVRLFGGGQVLNYAGPLRSADGVWASQQIPLVPSPAWTVQSGSIATADDFRAVLRSVDRISIRAEYLIPGIETDFLDDVEFGSCKPSAFASQGPEVICDGGPATLVVAVGGEANRTYQWRRRGVLLNDGADFSGTRTPTLGVARVTAADLGPYQCVVTNACGSITSNSATLSICFADTNCDGFLDFFDYSEFVDAFESGGANADFNRDGFLDFFDYLDFVTAFELGC